MTVNFIYITAASMDEARKIGRELVTSRLAACVNILDNMNSIYLWDGELREDMEVVMIAKTTGERVAQVVARVMALHSHDCPCIVSLPVSGGCRPFMDWIADQVEKE